MKISNSSRFPHPVLADFLADYSTGEINCEFAQHLTKADELSITADIQVTEPHLVRLLDRGDASVGFFIVCRRTFFNALRPAALGSTDHHFGATTFFGTVELRPLMWATSEVVQLPADAVHPEFGDNPNASIGAVLAIGPEFQFSVDQRRFRPFESIFSLQRVESVRPGCIEVETESDMISIGAESNTYDSIVAMRGIPAGRDILLGAVYLPAVMDVVAAIQANASSFSSCAWYSVFRAKCDELGIDPSDLNRTPLEIAQRLLKEPIRRTIAAIERDQ